MAVVSENTQKTWVRQKTSSTPASTTNAVTVKSNEFETALHQLQVAATNFGKDMIHAPKARAEYLKRIKEMSDEQVSLVKAKKITPHQAVIAANEARNEIMAMIRHKTSPLGLAIAEFMKKKGKTVAELEHLYASNTFNKPFAQLSMEQKNAVWLKIAEAAGRDRPNATQMAKWFGRAGRAFLIASLVITVYNIAVAQDKERQTYKEATVLGTSLVAGAVFVFLVGTPAGWITTAGLLIVGGSTAYFSDKAFDYYWPEDGLMK